MQRAAGTLGARVAERLGLWPQGRRHIRGGPISLYGAQRKRIHTKQEEMERGRHRDRRSCHPRDRDGAWLGVVVWVPAPGEASPRVP